MDPSAKPINQFMIIQNQAFHEDKLIHSKPRIDNKWKDTTFLTVNEIPSKKHYLTKERYREIENGNLRLLSKIYNIIFDRNKQFQRQYGKIHKESTKENTPKPPSYPQEGKVRSLNILSRRKENERINRDNQYLLNKLKDSKPTVFTNSELKQREKNIKILSSRTRKYNKTPASFLPILNARTHINPVVEQYLIRHDMISIRESSQMHTDSSNLKKMEEQGSVSKRNRSVGLAEIKDNSNSATKSKRKRGKKNNIDPRLHRSHIVEPSDRNGNLSMERVSLGDGRDSIGNPDYLTDNIEKTMKNLELSYTQENK